MHNIYPHFSQALCKNLLCHQVVILFHWLTNRWFCLHRYIFCSWNDDAEVVIKDVSVKNDYVSINIHESSHQKPEPNTHTHTNTHTSRESLSFPLTLMGLKLEELVFLSHMTAFLHANGKQLLVAAFPSNAYWSLFLLATDSMGSLF